MRKIFLFFYIVSIVYNLSGQTFREKSKVFFSEVLSSEYDSTYYEKLDYMLTAKSFLSINFSEFSINDNNISRTLFYSSNPKGAMGVGFSYKWLGVNLAYGTKNDADSIYGKTKRFDLKTQIYLRKLTINLYSTIYNGFYLENSYGELLGYNFGEYYKRTDIKHKTFGASGYYILNSAKYSNKATFIQNEWQKKTAGSFLVGGTILYNSIAGDSSLIPSQLIYPDFFGGVKYDKSKYFATGLNAGYTFTIVLHQAWFFDFSMLVGGTLGSTTIIDGDNYDKSGFKAGLSLLTRFGIGYNSKKFYCAMNYSNIQANSPLPVKDMGYGFSIGQLQLLTAYRFNVPEHRNILPSWIPAEL